MYFKNFWKIKKMIEEQCTPFWLNISDAAVATSSGVPYCSNLNFFHIERMCENAVSS